jgi:hypothetical protein
MLKRFDRLLWLDRRMAATGVPLTGQVKRLLAKHQRDPLDPQPSIEAPVPGYLGCLDTYIVGTLEGIGRIYAQHFIVANGAVAFSKPCLRKLPLTAVDRLHDPRAAVVRDHPFLRTSDHPDLRT